MSDLLASVKRSFYHEVLSYSDAEQRLEGKNGGYLFRESNVKPGMFILSYVRKSSVAHVLVPNKNRKFICQPLEEAVEIAADVIAASECYIHPVPPPPPSQGTSSRSETADSGGSGQTNKKHSKKAKKKGNKAGPSVGDVADKPIPHPGQVLGLECEETSEDPTVDFFKTSNGGGVS